ALSAIPRRARHGRGRPPPPPGRRAARRAGADPARAPRLRGGRRPHARRLGADHRLLQQAGGRVPARPAGYAGPDDERAAHGARHDHVAGQHGAPRRDPPRAGAARRPAHAHRGRGATPRRRAADGGDGAVQHPLDRDRLVADGDGAGLPARHQRHPAARARQRGGAAAPLGQPRRAADDHGVVPEGARHQVGGRADALALPQVHGARQQPRLVHGHPARDAADHRPAVPPLVPRDHVRRAPAGERGDAPDAAPVRRPDRPEHRPGDRAADRPHRRGDGARARGARQERRRRRSHVRPLVARRRALHPVPAQHGGAAHRGGERPDRHADHAGHREAARPPARAAEVRAPHELPEPLAGRDVAAPRHRGVRAHRRGGAGADGGAAARAVRAQLRRARPAAGRARRQRPGPAGVRDPRRPARRLRRGEARGGAAGRRRRGVGGDARDVGGGAGDPGRLVRGADGAAVPRSRQGPARGAALSEDGAVPRRPAAAAVRRRGVDAPAADGGLGGRPRLGGADRWPAHGARRRAPRVRRAGDAAQHGVLPRRGEARRDARRARRAAGADAARRSLQVVDGEHGRGVDAVGARAVRVPVHVAQRLGREGGRAPRAVRRGGAPGHAAPRGPRRRERGRDARALRRRPRRRGARAAQGVRRRGGHRGDARPRGRGGGRGARRHRRAAHHRAHAPGRERAGRRGADRRGAGRTALRARLDLPRARRHPPPRGGGDARHRGGLLHELHDVRRAGRVAGARDRALPGCAGRRAAERLPAGRRVDRREGCGRRGAGGAWARRDVRLPAAAPRAVVRDVPDAVQRAADERAV
ncbi:MAG: hypothetical protein AVDCRST_MAG11-1150, partial [uncultured Gemmatimonadaceae bacterium]